MVWRSAAERPAAGAAAGWQAASNRAKGARPTAKAGREVTVEFLCLEGANVPGRLSASSIFPCPVKKYLLFLVFLGAPVAAQDRPILRAAPLLAPIRLDGRLDEAAWRTADSITALTQVEPREGEQPTGRTVLRILAS